MAACPLTGLIIELQMPNPGKREFYYETSVTGKVRITDIALMGAANLSDSEKQILAGVTRNRTIRNEDPILITAQLLTQLYNQEVPYSFDERSRHLLTHLYNSGGKEYVTHNLNSGNDAPISYSSRDEFQRIIKYLEMEGWIKYDKITATMQSCFYQGVMITKLGIEEIEKGLPKMPLVSLVNERISTGNPEVDSKIEHAKKMFFDKHSTFDHKRSACENLSYVLEPLRDDLANFFSVSDVNDFFQLVNRFDIRHNKSTTINLVHEEQLEWVYYTLLNTINTYVKLKRKAEIQ